MRESEAATPWYVALVTSPKTGTGDVTAVVEQFASAAAFQHATGSLPSQTGVPGETDAGYPTKTAAQKAADAYNTSGAGKSATGAAPYNDSILAGTPGPGKNPLSGLAAIGDFFTRLSQASTWLRVAEVLLGAGLIIVSLARLAADTPVGRAATRVGKVAAIL